MSHYSQAAPGRIAVEHFNTEYIFAINNNTDNTPKLFKIYLTNSVILTAALSVIFAGIAMFI